MNAEQIAREIAGEIKVAILGRSQSILASDLNVAVEEIADRIKPLVERLAKSQVPLEVLTTTFLEQSITEICKVVQQRVISECLENRAFLFPGKRGTP